MIRKLVLFSFLILILFSMLYAVKLNSPVYGDGTATPSPQPIHYREIHKIETEQIHLIVLWHPNRGIFASATDGFERVKNSIFIWSDNGELVTALEPNSAYDEAIAWSPNGEFLANTTHMQDVYIWSVDSWEKVYQISLEQYILGDQYYSNMLTSLVWSPDGTQLAILNDYDIDIWTISTGTVEIIPEDVIHVNSIDWSSDGSYIVGSDVTDGQIEVWDAETLDVVMTLVLDASFYGEYGHHGKLVDWHPNDMRLAIASNNYYDKGNYVFIRDMSDEGKLITTLVGHSALIYSLAWSPDGSKLATASADGTVCIWDGTTYETIAILEGHTDSVLYVSWSPDGRRLVTTSTDHTIRIWEEQ